MVVNSLIYVWKWGPDHMDHMCHWWPIKDFRPDWSSKSQVLASTSQWTTGLLVTVDICKTKTAGWNHRNCLAATLGGCFVLNWWRSTVCFLSKSMRMDRHLRVSQGSEVGRSGFFLPSSTHRCITVAGVLALDDIFVEWLKSTLLPERWLFSGLKMSRAWLLSLVLFNTRRLGDLNESIWSLFRMR